MNRLLCRVRPVSLLLGIGLVLCLSVSHPLAAQDIPVTPPSTDNTIPLVVPESTVVIPVPITSDLLLSDDQFLAGGPWQGDQIQRLLEERLSPLAHSTLEAFEGHPVPASEALSALGNRHTVSSAVLLTLAEMEFGVLRPLDSGATSLSSEANAALSLWLRTTTEALSRSFYQQYDLGTAQSGDSTSAASVPTDRLNAASYAIAEYLAAAGQDLTVEAAREQQQRFVATYTAQFGSPLEGGIHAAHPSASADAADSPATEPPLPPLQMPWGGTGTWKYNGGPHGSNREALDFQPLDKNGCSPNIASDRWVAAAAGGRVTYASSYMVIIDHDSDGNTTTGWQTFYLHVANIQVSVNSEITPGTSLGNPSCYGGDGTSTGVHVHFAVRYHNASQAANGRVISGWRVEQGVGPYHGYLRKGNITRESGCRLSSPTGNCIWNHASSPVVSDNCRLNRYLAEYYSGVIPNVTYPPVRTACVDHIRYDWGSGTPDPSIGSDNFSVRWEGVFAFNGGEKSFFARTDDGMRVWIDDTQLLDKWFPQGATTYYLRHTPSANPHRMRVEYYEQGGGATARWGWCPATQFMVDYFNNKTLSGNPVYSGCMSSIDRNWGTGGPGNGVGTDNFSVRWYGRSAFESGAYGFFASTDDGMRAYLDNNLIIDRWYDQPLSSYRTSRSMSAGLHNILVEYYESGGGALARFRWGKNLTAGRSADASSYQSSTYTPGKASDGNYATRWSSFFLNTLLDDQWWFVDLGSRKEFDRISIYWEAAYATDYLIGWRDADSCYGSYSGYRYTGGHVGWSSYDVGLRTARCIAVFMYDRAPGKYNYSFWEVEAYRVIYTPSVLSVAVQGESIRFKLGAPSDSLEQEYLAPDGRYQMEQPASTWTTTP